MLNSSLKARRSIALSILVIPSLMVSAAGQTASAVQPMPVAEAQTIADKLAAAPIVNQPVDKAEYTLGPGDQLTVQVFGADDLPPRPIEVGPDGKINLPMVGKVRASGISVRDLEADLTTRYGAYFRDPEVSVSVTDYRSQPVTVVGAVNSPNVIQLRGPTRLMQVISQAGGLRPDAGDRVMITRQVPMDKDSTATGGLNDPNAKFYVKPVDLLKIIDGTDPAANILIQAHDVITVPRAKMVYVVGDVGKPGAYVLDGHSSSLSVLQAIALAGGVNHTAASSKTRILRSTGNGGTNRVETMINLNKIMGNKSPDVSLHADDILFVPNSTAKNAGLRTLEMAVNVGTGLAVWRF